MLPLKQGLSKTPFSASDGQVSWPKLARGYSTAQKYSTVQKLGGSHLGAVDGSWGASGQWVVSSCIELHLFLSIFIPLSPLVISPLFIFITVTIVITIIMIFYFISVINLFLFQPMGCSFIAGWG